MGDARSAGFRRHLQLPRFLIVARGKLAYGLGLALVISACGAGPSAALPPGRAWAPVQQLAVPNYTYLPNPRLETDVSGLPMMFVSARHGSVEDGVGVRWADSTWQVCVQNDLAFGTLQPVISPLGTFVGSGKSGP